MVWTLSIAFALIPLSYSVARSLLRGDVGVDVIALVSMGGSLILGEYLAGAVIALMLSGDPVRALAVFVVATPCPLIHATHVALISGISRTWRVPCCRK
jgi:cation transport ATPase